LNNIENYLHLSSILKTTAPQPISAALDGKNLQQPAIFIIAIHDGQRKKAERNL